MTYHPDYPTPSAAALEWANKAKLDAKSPENAPRFHPNLAKPLIDNEEPETTPSPLANKLEKCSAALLPDGRIAMDARDWEQIVDMHNDFIDGVLKHRETIGTDAFNAQVVKMFERKAAADDFASRRERAGVRTPGFLGSAAAVRRELAQVYRESYAAGPAADAFYTRLTWMLDCLARTAALEQKLQPEPRKKAGQSGGE